jgi:hypothetical protein
MRPAVDELQLEAERVQAARVAIGRLVEQGRLDANVATRQLLALDLQVRQSRRRAQPAAMSSVL